MLCAANEGILLFGIEDSYFLVIIAESKAARGFVPHITEGLGTQLDAARPLLLYSKGKDRTV